MNTPALPSTFFAARCAAALAASSCTLPDADQSLAAAADAADSALAAGAATPGGPLADAPAPATDDVVVQSVLMGLAGKRQSANVRGTRAVQRNAQS